MKSVETNTTQNFQQALDDLTEKVKQDKNILAILLFGSLSYDRVWEKSDIDLMFIISDRAKSKGQREALALTERDVNIHANLFTRTEFKQLIEGSLQSSFMHSSFSKSKLLYTRDESIKELYEQIYQLGSRDQQTQLFQAGASILPLIFKAEKFCYVKKDPQYAYVWIMYMYTGLAKVEVYQAGQIAGREVIHQALKLNPDFFDKIYTQLLNAPKTEARITETLQQIDAYLTKRIPLMFQPLLDYLNESGIICSATEISHWARQQMNANMSLAVCEWLADKEIIHKASTPVRLTTKSFVEVEELAFYYEA